MDNKLPFQTLHCHTTTSDGLLSYKQVLDECAKNKIGIVAFTDHDSLPKPENIKELKNINHEVKFVCGIEISANVVAEVSSQISLFHIVGLFVDPTNTELINYCKLAQEKRIERAQRMLKNIVGLGFDITMEEVNSFAGGETIGRPHVAKAIIAKDKNLKRIDELMEEFKKAALNDEILMEKYNHAVLGDYWQKIFDLFLDDKSWIKNIYVHYLVTLSMDDAVKLIRGAGGIAVLAHWSYLKYKINADLVEKFCLEKRLDGLETIYGFGMSLDEKSQFISDMELMEGLVKKYDLVRAGGGDFHKPEDFSLMIDKNYLEYAQRTKGLVEYILQEYPHIDLSWTSLET